jgi:hypothetical protein
MYARKHTSVRVEVERKEIANFDFRWDVMDQAHEPTEGLRCRIHIDQIAI